MKKREHLSFLDTIFLLFYILLYLGCGKEQTTIVPAINAMPTNDKIIHPETDTTTGAVTGVSAKFLALGDSYTIGQNVQQYERFPAQTVQLLRSQNLNISDPQYVATTGWTTTNLLSATKRQNPPKDFDIVTLLIGVNDQYQQRDTAGYREKFSELLNKAVKCAGSRTSHVFVLSIPDYSVIPFVAEAEKARVSTEIDLFNAINKEVTLQNNITYIDITPSTRQAANDASLIAHDGLHPSAKEYAVWANMLAPLIKKALQ